MTQPITLPLVHARGVITSLVANLLSEKKQYLPSKSIELWNLAQTQVNMEFCKYFKVGHLLSFSSYATLKHLMIT